MARGFNATAVIDSEKSLNSVATLIEVLVDPSDPAYITDFARDISHDSKTFTSLQGLISVSSIIENNTNGIESLSFSLSAVPDEFTKLFLDYSYIDRSIKVHKVFLDAAGAVVGNSMLVFDGRIDKPVIKHDPQGGTATIGITASSHWANFTRKSGRFTNDAMQKTFFSGDDCFKFAIDYEKEIKWGQD